MVGINEADQADKCKIETQGLVIDTPGSSATGPSPESGQSHDLREGGNATIATKAATNETATAGKDLYMNLATDEKNPKNAQRVTFDAEQKGTGFFYVQGNELKVTSTDPPWDTWMACDGHEGFPLLWWAAVVTGTDSNGTPNAVVTIPGQACSAIRLFVDSDPSSTADDQCCPCAGYNNTDLGVASTGLPIPTGNATAIPSGTGGTTVPTGGSDICEQLRQAGQADLDPDCADGASPSASSSAKPSTDPDSETASSKGKRSIGESHLRY